MFFAACKVELQGIDWNSARRLQISKELIHLELPNGVARDSNGDEIGHVAVEYGSSINSILNFSEDNNISHKAYVFALTLHEIGGSYQTSMINLRVEFHTSAAPTDYQIRGLAEVVDERGVGGWAIDERDDETLIPFVPVRIYFIIDIETIHFSGNFEW